MDLLALNNMSADEVKAVIRIVSHEVESLAAWRSLAVSSFGSFLKKHKQERLELVRRVYAAIDVCEDGAINKFARVQGYEESVLADLENMENLENRKETLDKQLESLRLVLQQKKEGRSDEGSSIISDHVRREAHDGRE